MNSKPAVYLETTIPSFLTSRPSLDVIVKGKQAVTRDWWNTQRGRFDLVISQFVLDEASSGDPKAAQKRLEVLAGIDLLEIDGEVLRITEQIMNKGVIPSKATTDAAHIAVASRHHVEYLLTWNCTHIANAEILCKMNYVISESGYLMPTICTPDELFGTYDHEY